MPEFRAQRPDRGRSEPDQVADLQGPLDLFEENLDGPVAFVVSADAGGGPLHCSRFKSEFRASTQLEPLLLWAVYSAKCAKEVGGASCSRSPQLSIFEFRQNRVSLKKDGNHFLFPLLD